MPVIGPGGATNPTSSALRNLDTSFLKTVNPKLDEVLKRTPGLDLFLAGNTVSTGAKAGQAASSIDWPFWNHSAATGKKYGHSMTDAQIKADTIIVFQPTKAPGACVSFGGRRFPGHEIIGVFNVGDQVTGVSGYDGGFLGSFRAQAHGPQGDKATIAWAVVSIAQDGHVRGGGYPTTDASGPVPYQRNQHGAEYRGRAGEIEFGKQAYMPITDS